ncbi:uncharacterized protein LOC111588782 isoform X1 [Amphiprion ocellaris]|uniref:uncharacterized protein LOC111588782 isoform X1 n=1 Tax=Amphiprion ocellaris TaxID=80972 RepID=UPI001649F867|nr:uncharacterized protein LOC111588782 isoform X1 [Amphiprion ocellaris]
MKTFCVAVVVLSLISVCQAASLACQKLMKPVDKDPDISGTWHYIAVSTEHCWSTTLLNVFFWPSAAVDITAKGTPNIYDANVKIKMYGMCNNESESFHYANHNVFNIDSNNAPTGEADVLLQTGCPDCLVVKGVDILNTLTLFSKDNRGTQSGNIMSSHGLYLRCVTSSPGRRKSVDAAELKEFETQAQCLGWSKPLVLSTDHDYENCISVDDSDIDEAAATTFFTKMYERVKSMHHKVTECIKDTFLAYLPTSIFQK